jgi:hypothetical protein
MYKESKIITLCIPVYALYLLQPLNIGYFLLLKRAYRTKINGLVYNYINYINKLSFLVAFRMAFNRAFIKANIYASFRGARLVPFNLEVVLLKLNIKLRTPTPLVVDNTL